MRKASSNGSQEALSVQYFRPFPDEIIEQMVASLTETGEPDASRPPKDATPPPAHTMRRYGDNARRDPRAPATEAPTTLSSDQSHLLRLMQVMETRMVTLLERFEKAVTNMLEYRRVEVPTGSGGYEQQKTV